MVFESEEQRKAYEYVKDQIALIEKEGINIFREGDTQKLKDSLIALNSYERMKLFRKYFDVLKKL